jgi:hypothetical protein
LDVAPYLSSKNGTKQYGVDGSGSTSNPPQEQLRQDGGKGSPPTIDGFGQD